ncbi:SfsA [Leadbettera azotonutricia ZAS-9]|uniref:SfsA n=1 Tax=Leadbettera azotonutricia (strain ATCC BAA-888 / DSM 13862 / ZAS-9) TaxID=545695 RepID=F5Y6K5_LEAAZ|nr:SfsA [Leadbettera azotonutricia ZAS-9]
MPLILEKRAIQKAGGSLAKTAWTAAAIRYNDTIMPLYASRANLAAEKLILKKTIPGLQEIHPEFSLGGSRFDFLCIDRQGQRHLVEVKACSLVEHRVAMFPDAPSGRALKHLEELARLNEEGYFCHVLFVITQGSPKIFIPNLHTDPQFAAALSQYCLPAEKGTEAPVQAHAALIRCDEDGMAELVSPSTIPMDLSYGKLAASDSGSYLIVLELAQKAEAEIGSLGRISFEKGWYVYAGSAMKNLSSRISRHLRKTHKKKHWHLDYLTPHAQSIKGFPVISFRNLECDLAGDLIALGGKPIAGFGSSDCKAKGAGKKACPSHLVFFPSPPLLNHGFTDIIFKYRSFVS